VRAGTIAIATELAIEIATETEGATEIATEIEDGGAGAAEIAVRIGASDTTGLIPRGRDRHASVGGVARAARLTGAVGRSESTSVAVIAAMVAVVV